MSTVGLSAKIFIDRDDTSKHWFRCDGTAWNKVEKSELNNKYSFWVRDNPFSRSKILCLHWIFSWSVRKYQTRVCDPTWQLNWIDTMMINRLNRTLTNWTYGMNAVNRCQPNDACLLNCCRCMFVAILFLVPSDYRLPTSEHSKSKFALSSSTGKNGNKSISSQTSLCCWVGGTLGRFLSSM